MALLEMSEVRGTDPVIEYPLPENASRPLGITVDAAGTVWVAVSSKGSIMEFHPESKSFIEHPIPGNHSGCEVWSLVPDKEGNIWFGDAVSNAIWRFDPGTDTYQRYPIPTPDAYPFHLMFDERETLWFTELYGGKLGELRTEKGIIREYIPPTLLSGPSGFDFDNNGTLWFSEGFAQQLGSFDPLTGNFDEYSLKNIAKIPRGVQASDDGKIWVADSESSSIIIFDTVSKEAIPYSTSLATYGSESAPYFIVPDGKGRYWFNERFGNKIGRIDPKTMIMTEIELPYSPTSDLPGYVPPPCCKVPAGLPVVPREILCLTSDARGNVWFTESLGNRIGLLEYDQTPPVNIRALQNPLHIPEGGKTEIDLEIRSSLSDSSGIRITHTYPVIAEGISVGSLYVDRSRIRQNQPFVFTVPVDIYPPADVENSSLTFSIHADPYTVSYPIRLTFSDISEKEVPTATQAGETAVAAGTLIILGFISAVFISRKRRSS
jgi:virginiamycin B lyase